MALLLGGRSIVRKIHVPGTWDERTSEGLLIRALEELIGLETHNPFREIYKGNVSFVDAGSNFILRGSGLQNPLGDDFAVLLTGGRLGLDVHIELEGLRILLRTVLDGITLRLNLVTLNIGVIGGAIMSDVQVPCITEAEFMRVPRAEVKMEVSILMFLTAYAGL